MVLFSAGLSCQRTSDHQGRRPCQSRVGLRELRPFAPFAALHAARPWQRWDTRCVSGSPSHRKTEASDIDSDFARTHIRRFGSFVTPSYTRTRSLPTPHHAFRVALGILGAWCARTYHLTAHETHRHTSAILTLVQLLSFFPFLHAIIAKSHTHTLVICPVAFCSLSSLIFFFPVVPFFLLLHFSIGVYRATLRVPSNLDTSRQPHLRGVLAVPSPSPPRPSTPARPTSCITASGLKSRSLRSCVHLRQGC